MIAQSKLKEFEIENIEVFPGNIEKTTTIYKRQIN